MDFAQDRISLSSPGEWSSVGVVSADKVVDLRDQVFDAAKSTAANPLLGNEIEPEFDLVEQEEQIRGWASCSVKGVKP